jgi:hypothetical protein
MTKPSYRLPHLDLILPRTAAAYHTQSLPFPAPLVRRRISRCPTNSTHISAKASGGQASPPRRANPFHETMTRAGAHAGRVPLPQPSQTGLLLLHLPIAWRRVASRPGPLGRPPSPYKPPPSPTRVASPLLPRFATRYTPKTSRALTPLPLASSPRRREGSSSPHRARAPTPPERRHPAPYPVASDPPLLLAASGGDPAEAR